MFKFNMIRIIVFFSEIDKKTKHFHVKNCINQIPVQLYCQLCYANCTENVNFSRDSEYRAQP